MAEGVCMAGGHVCAGGMHGRGMYLAGVCAWQGVCIAGDMHAGGEGACMVGGMHSRRDGHCSGWYASYWNAFLFVCKFVLPYHKTSIMTPTHLFAGIAIPPVRLKTSRFSSYTTTSIFLD